jgi:hypothetical protein
VLAKYLGEMQGLRLVLEEDKPAVGLAEFATLHETLDVIKP